MIRHRTPSTKDTIIRNVGPQPSHVNVRSNPTNPDQVALLAASRVAAVIYRKPYSSVLHNSNVHPVTVYFTVHLHRTDVMEQWNERMP